MDILEKLGDRMLGQEFCPEQEHGVAMNAYSRIARTYAEVENAVAVLSDLKSNASRIFYGGIASRLGLSGCEQIDSIWEEEIYSRIHPDDLMGRHLLEMRFFMLLKTLSADRVPNYHTESRLRMRDAEGNWIIMRHRTFLVNAFGDGEFPLSLCLYNFSSDQQMPLVFEGAIVDAAAGVVVRPDHEGWGEVLTAREREVLEQIKSGAQSKEIAVRLSISLYTVSRHRQNILAKLRVGNSIEALRVAQAMGIV